jgi:hypothetical protein
MRSAGGEARGGRLASWGCPCGRPHASRGPGPCAAIEGVGRLVAERLMRALVVVKSEVPADAGARLRAPPLQTSLRFDALEVPHEQHPEVHTGRDRRAPALVVRFEVPRADMLHDGRTSPPTKARSASRRTDDPANARDPHPTPTSALADPHDDPSTSSRTLSIPRRHVDPPHSCFFNGLLADAIDAIVRGEVGPAPPLAVTSSFAASRRSMVCADLLPEPATWTKRLISHR